MTEMTPRIAESTTTPPSFDALIGDLKKWLITDSKALDPDQNPVFRDWRVYPANELRSTLLQYNIFSRTIVPLLEAAHVVAIAGKRQAVSDELARNIAEERGADSDSGESHYQLLCRGFERSLGLDLKVVTEGRATARFFGDVAALAGNSDPAVSCGAVYALECTAVPELRETYSMTKGLFALSDLPIDECVSMFFEGHIGEIEVGHEMRLADACRANLRESEFRAFDAGFRGVVESMRRWWSGLSEGVGVSARLTPEIHVSNEVRVLPTADEMAQLTMPRLRTLPPADAFLATGVSISPGAAVGRLSTDIDAFLADRDRGRNTILIVDTISNALLADLRELRGVIACREDSTTHAAIVARVRRLPVVSGPCMSALRSAVGTTVTIEATGGFVYSGVHEVLPAETLENLRPTCTALAARSPLRVHGNCDTSAEMELGVDYGALAFEARSEHMFADPSQLAQLQGALLFEDRDDLLGLYEATLTEELRRCLDVVDGRPIHLRLLDPPIDEFIPRSRSEVARLARVLSVRECAIQERCEILAEANPLLGRRGARLLVQRPDLVDAQVSAIAAAYLAADPDGTRSLVPHICLPFVFDVREIEVLRHLIDSSLRATNWTRPSMIGAMLELPQALLDAGRFADAVDFASVGSNDLTALLHGMGRGSAYEAFLGQYLSDGILDCDPFVTLDPICQRLIASAVSDLHDANPGIQVSLCGEQATCRSTVETAMRIGLDSLSVAPVHVPTLNAEALEVQGRTGRASMRTPAP